MGMERTRGSFMFLEMLGKVTEFTGFKFLIHSNSYFPSCRALGALRKHSSSLKIPFHWFFEPQISILPIKT